MPLNADQAASVAHDGHLVVLACPGSGKTTVLVERAARLRRQSASDPILVVTFTREAAREVRERLSKALPSLDALRVATFHSFALQQLLSVGGARVCSPADQTALMRRAWLEVCSDTTFASFAAAVEAYTCGDQTALGDLQHSSAYDRYLELLLEFSAIDFSQAILRAITGMAEGTLPPLPCRHLLVDEVQDIDASQLDWLDAHVQAGAWITAVGDDDQSIYGFRHAMGFRGMSKIARTYQAEIIALSTNYRSHEEVLSWANRLIVHNKDRIPKSLTAYRGPGGGVYLHDQSATDLDEAALVASYAFQSQGRFAIIARTNRKLDLVAAVLSEREIPFTRHGQRGFWEAEDPALFLSLLSPLGLSDPLPRSALIVRSGLPTDGREPPQLQALRRELMSHRRSPDPSILINAVASYLHSNTRGLRDTRVEGAKRTVEACRRSLLKMTGTIDERVALARRPSTAKPHRIVLLTMHGAKGLEFPTVWILGCQANAMPHPKCSDMEEERRLLYVAMTRAERDLHLSFAHAQVCTRKTGDGAGTTYLRALPPSPFLVNDLDLTVVSPPLGTSP